MGDRGFSRWYRPIVVGLAVVILAIGAYMMWLGFAAQDWGQIVGFDQAIYADGAQRWLHGGGFYLDRQLHGPYDIVEGDVLYPPTALWAFVPLSFLPAFAWWVLPIGFVAWSVWRWHPAPWAWPLLALCLVAPNTLVAFVTGYPGLLMAAVIAAGLRWGWPGALVLLKPSLLPFALIGIRSRGWWLATAGLVVLTLPLLAMLPDWLHATLDGRGWGGWLYSLREVPLMLLPVVAWAGRSRAVVGLDLGEAAGGARPGVAHDLQRRDPGDRREVDDMPGTRAEERQPDRDGRRRGAVREL